MKKFFLRVSDKKQGLDRAMGDLLAGQHRHDVLQTAVRALELDPADDSVGYGGFPNVLGEMELDGAFMDGDNRNLGAIAGVKNYLPVRVARRLMESGMHTLLTGAGAELFARECGLDPELTLSENQRGKHFKDVLPLLEERGQTPLMEIVRKLAGLAKGKNLDTTVMIACDGKGLSAAASTSGWPYKFPGRAGDTPVAGAGFYVDSRYGAAACTYTGEMSMRAGTARYVVAQMEAGKSPQAAVQAAARDLKSLSGGVRRELIIHAVSSKGQVYVVAVNSAKPINFMYWCEGMKAPEMRTAKPVKIKWPVPRR